MITKIEVDGFKSLRNFDLKLKQGLNILVGPNGAGKTNIILFFEFLSNIINNPIGNAISYVGGAGSIFQKKGDDEYSDTIRTKIYGCNQLGSKRFIAYEFSFEIKISFEKDNVFYTNQEIKLKSSTRFWDDPDASTYKQKWDIHLNFRMIDDNKQDILITKFDRKKIKTRFFNEKANTKEFENTIKEFVTDQNPSYNSIIRCLFPITELFRQILTDLRGGETFNVVPSKVRELEDSASPPGIKKDGSGLATTLYAMKKSRTRQSERGFRFYFAYEEPQKTYSPKTLDRIVSFLKAANSSIQSLDVDNDPFNNKLRVKIKVKSGDYEAVLPLSAMSDGTIKWLTLITAILTSKTVFSIEEPENFLHPWMQAEIAIIMRNHLQEKQNKAFVLMTTHSESLLNHANPEEIIIVDLSGGRTKARRIDNIQIIKDEISNSGFGLGHFYFSNALSDE